MWVQGENHGATDGHKATTETGERFKSASSETVRAAVCCGVGVVPCFGL